MHKDNSFIAKQIFLMFEDLRHVDENSFYSVCDYGHAIKLVVVNSGMILWSGLVWKTL